MWVWAAATVAVLVAIAALPATRTAAQRLWDDVFIGRFAVVTTDFEHGAAASLFSPEMRRQPEPSPVASLEEAANTAGFWPRLPGPGVFSAQPKFSVTDVGLAALPIVVEDLAVVAAHAFRLEYLPLANRAPFAGFLAQRTLESSESLACRR